MDIRKVLIDATRFKLAAGSTQAAIAKAANITPGKLCNFLAGRCDLNTATASRLAAAVDVKVDGPSLRPPTKKKPRG